MRKFFKGAILILALMVGLGMTVSPVMADFGHKHYKISVYADEGFTTNTGGTSLITSGITYKVLTDDTNTAATLYSDAAGTAMTNPITTTVFDAKTRIDFYVASSVTAVDIIIVDTAGGYTAFLDDATVNTRTAIIDERPGVQHHGMIWFQGTTTVDGTCLDTGIDFDVGSLIHHVLIEIIDGASTSQFLTVGIDTGDTSHDHDGFINDMILSAVAGWYDPMRIGVSSLASDGQLFVINATKGNPLGNLLGAIQEGTTSSTVPDPGLRISWSFPINSNAVSLCYGVSSDAAIAGGYIHYFFTRLRWSESERKLHP